MAENAWERYKREHGLDKQEQTKATETKSTENAWERFKREHGTMESNPNFRNDLYAENQKAKQQREQRSNLNARRRELESTAPTVTGNRDAEWADYYRNMLNYAAETGDRSLYYDNLSKYKASSEKVSGQYASQMARHSAQDAGIDKIFGLGDKLGFNNYHAKAAEQKRRYDRDAGFYQQMKNDAQLMGNKDLYNKAAQGRGESYARYMRAYDKAYNADMQHLQENAPDLYIAHTETDEDVNAKLEELKQRREEAKARAEALDKELNDLKMSGQITSIDSHGVANYGPKQREANAANAEVLALDKEIETYTKAARVQKNNRGAALYEQYLGGGKVLDPETFKKIDAGKARYEADRKAAIAKGDETLDYGLNFFAKARGVWRGDKDRLEEAGWDPTFDTAANLRSEDENTFYALYADDPQKAMDFITYANNYRNDQYEQWMAEWAHEDGWNATGAFFQALGNRIGSGVANLVDPHSATANQLAQTSSGLLAGGSQLLNEWSGTFDTDIPILRDLINGKGLGDFYQLANSVLESGINAYVAGKLGAYIPGDGAREMAALGTMIMGSSASAADYNESIKRGLTPGEAQKHALAAGINEALFEFFSMDKLVDTEKLMMAGTMKDKIKAIFIQSGVEASEEFCTTIANRLADGAQARRDGYDSQIEHRAKELIALGKSRDEALEKAEKEWWTELINDAIGGFISGGLHDAGALAITAPMRAVSYIQGERAMNRTYGQLASDAQQAAMRAYAADNGIAWNSAENAATAQNEGVVGVQNAETESAAQNANAETEGTDSLPTAQNDNEGQQTQEQPKTRQAKRQDRREARTQAKSERETGADVRRVQEHIDKQLAGKTVQEQTAIRDKLVQQYGEAFAPAVYSAVQKEARANAAQFPNAEAISRAKEAALDGVSDPEMRQVVSSAYDQAAVDLAIQTKNTEALGRYYQQIRGTGTGNMTMEAIVNGKDGRETRSAITGMSEDGKSVTLADGSTVAVKELQADADTMDIIHEISALGLGKNTDKVFQAYQKSGRSGMDGYRWIMDYTTAIDQGRTGRISLSEAIKRSSLDAETVMEAYEMGHKESMDETRKTVQENKNRPKRKGITGRVANIDTSAIQNEPMSKQEREQFDLANQIFEILGVDVKWESSKAKNGKYVGANGSYLGGVITLDIHAGRNDALKDINSGILATTGHELTHFLQEYAPEQYQALKEFVLQQIVKNSKYGEATLERMIQDKQRRHQAAKSADSSPTAQNDRSESLSRRRAEDEVVADACQTMLRDSKALREFAEKKPEAAKGVIRWLDKWFSRIKAAFSRSAQLSEQARFMERLEKDVREAFGQLWDDALREAVRVHDEIGNMESPATEGGEQNMDRSYAEQVDEVLANTFDDQNQVYMGTTPTRLSRILGLPKIPMLTTPTHVFSMVVTEAQAMNDPRYDPNENYHGLGDRMVKNLPEIINKPVLIIKSNTNANDARFVVVTNKKDSSGDPIIAAIEPNGKGKIFNLRINENAFLSGYGKQRFQNYLTKALNENRILYAYNNSQQKNSPGLQLPNSILSADYTNNLSQFKQIVNQKFAGTMFQSNSGDKYTQFSERDYDTPSDLELMEQAAEGLTESGSAAYWENLLQSAPDLAGDKVELAERARDYKTQAKKLEKVTAELAEAKRNLTRTNRKLNTKGIFPMVQGIMKDMAAGDVKGLKVNKNVEKILIDAYQKALDQIDEGADAGTAWETVYNEGVAKAVDYMMENATVSEKIGYKWEVSTMEKRYGAEGRQYLLDLMTGKVAEDFAANRYRAAIQETEADRLVERTEKQMQKKVDAQKARVSELKAQNETLTDQKDRLENDLQIWRDSHRKASEQVTFLNEQLQETRKELRESNKLSAKERKAKHEQAQRLDAQLKAKRTEANAWKAMAERNEALLRAALQSKNADLDALRVQMDRQATEAQKRQAKLVQELADQKQREADILAGKLKPLAMQRLLKAVREEAAEKATAHKEEVFQRYKERKQETAIRNKIKNLHTEMSRDLLKPREGHFVPQELIRPVVDLLEMVNTQTNRAKGESAQEKIDAINAAYDRIKKDERYSQYYDDTVKDMLVELSSTLEGRSIYELNASELADVYTAMKAMRTTIRNAIKADLIEQGKEIWEIGNDLRQELRNGKGASPYLIEKYHMAMLSAKRAFNRFGGYMPNSTWNKIYRMLNDAQLKMLNLEMLGTQIFDSVLKGKDELRQARALQSYDKKDLVDVGLKDTNGNAVPIPRGMMISLYMHLQNEDNMRHVMYGGLTLPDFKRYYKGSDEAWGQKTVEIPALGARVSNLDTLLETIGEDGVDQQYADLQAEIREMFESVRSAIEDNLSDYERKWIAASKEFFDVFSRNVLNEVTNSMYGFSKAKVDNYFPIVTDPSFLKSDFETISRNASLENMGFMKDRVKAGNPILLEDITKAVNRQISNVSRYAGLTEAMKTFGRVYNVQTKGFTDSVKKAMAKTYGKNGQKYIENLMADMVGARSQPGTIFDRVKGKYAQAVLAANLIVTVKQAASYPTAAATIGWKPLAKALAKGGKNGLPISRADRELIDTYSPLLWYRSKGSVDTEIGEMAHAQDWTKKAKWLMGWIQGADKATVGRLWYAAEYYVEDNFNLAKGTQEQIKSGKSEFYQKVAEVFSDIVQDTQPNYTVLERPDILRSPNKLVRALVMFSTQRFQNANILIDAVGEYSAMKRYDKQNRTAESKAIRKAAKRKLTRAISSQVVAAAVLETMQLLGSMVLHRMKAWRDDDDELTQESILEEYLNGFFSTLAGAFLGGSELYEALDSMLSGSRYYGNDVGGMSTLNDFVTAVVNGGQKLKALLENEDSTPEDWKSFAEKQLTQIGLYLSQMTGVPIGNVNKIIAGGKNHIIDAMNGEFWSFEAGVDRSNKVNARRYMKAVLSGDQAKAEQVMEEMRRNILADKPDMKEDKVNDKITGAIRSYLKEQYLKGDISEESAMEYLLKYGGKKKDKDAWNLVRRWEATEEHKDDDDYSFGAYDDFLADIDEGDSFETAAAEYLEHGYKEDALRSEAVEHGKARYLDGDMTEEEAIDYLQKYRGWDYNDSWFKVREWEESADYTEDDGGWGKYDALHEAIDANQDISGIIQEYTAHGVKEKAIRNAAKEYIGECFVNGKITEDKMKNWLSRYCGIRGEDANKALNAAKCKKATGYAPDDLGEHYREGEISKADVKNALTKYSGMSSTDADKRIRWWDQQKAHPDLQITEGACNNWYDGSSKTRENGHESAKAAGMSLEAYLAAKKELDKITDANGNSTGEDEYIAALAKMNLTPRQKDALYYEKYKGTTKYSTAKSW